LKVEVELEIPFDRGELVARVHEEGDVLEETYTGNGTRLVARIRSEALPDFTKYLITN
jgi:GTP-binding protein HflX